MECKLISEHFIRSDYWHIYPIFFFIFRPFLNELNSKCCYYTGTNIFCEAINEIEAGIGQKKLT